MSDLHEDTITALFAFIKQKRGKEGKPEFKEITIKFSGKLVSDPFTAKDGKEYVSIKIPSRDETDKSPWASFVLPANRVHDDQFGKGVWAKIPENGSTTIRKDKVVGQDENGKRIYETEKTRVPNSKDPMISSYCEASKE